MECERCRWWKAESKNWVTNEQVCRWCDMIICFKALGAQIVIAVLLVVIASCLL